MICANCRHDHPTIKDVRLCFNASRPDCKHELPNGWCPCTWEFKPMYYGTYSYVHMAREQGFCTVCEQLYDVGTRIVRSRQTWGRWVHLRDCSEVAKEHLSNPPREYETSEGRKPWLEELGVPRQMLECEDSFFIDPREEIWDTDDALQELLVSEGIDAGLITEWREMLPDVVDRTILMALADELVEEEAVEEWELEVELMHLAHLDSR